MLKELKELVKTKQYDGVIFHRVIDGFMAQTGDVQYGNSNSNNYKPELAGTGGSNLPDLKAEFSDLPHEKELCLWQDLKTLIALIANFLFALNHLHT